MDRHSKVGPEELSRKWNIGLQMAKDTLDVTTQHGVRTAVHPMSRQLRVDHLHLHRPRLKGMWFLDTMIAKVKSLLGNKCANMFTNGKFTKVVPMTSCKEAAKSLIDFSDDVGVGKEMPISRIVVAVPNATVVLLDLMIEVRKDLVCCLLVTCLLHSGGTFLVRVRFFEHPSFIHVTSPNTLLWCHPFSLDGTKLYIVPLLGLSSLPFVGLTV
jgi:hypothetical protein